jgi:hypothetical protein
MKHDAHSLPKEHYRKVKCAICLQKIRVIRLDETRSRLAVTEAPDPKSVIDLFEDRWNAALS